MGTDLLHGSSMLFDPSRGVVLRGEIRLQTDGKGRSEITVKNDVTGVQEHLVFQTGALWIPVMQLIQAIQDTHTDVEIGLTVIDGSGGVCSDCHGLKEMEDDEGNWVACKACGGRI